jgi:gamma-glutamyltranspeptidase
MFIPVMHRRQFLATASATVAAAWAPSEAPAAEPAADRPDDPTGFLGRRSPVFTRHCIASSSSPLATQVGLRVLEDGGNAFDAAVAMAGMMAVVEPMMSGLGGDTMILAWSAKDGKVFGLNGSGVAPSGASLERIGNRPMMPETGATSVTIPGAVDGWCRLLERFGSRSLARLWEPAVAAARDGYPVGESIAGTWAVAAPQLPKFATPELLKLLLPDGKPPLPGSLVRFPQLADTLDRVAQGGREAFYAGPVAQAIAGTLSVRYRGRDVLGLPPNSQSVVALVALGILEGYDLAAMGESARLHHEIEALRLGFEFAIDELGEPTEAMLEKVRRALGADGLAEFRGRITDRATAAVHPQGGNTADTTYVCAIDKDGNAVSLMSSICGAPNLPPGVIGSAIRQPSRAPHRWYGSIAARQAWGHASSPAWTTGSMASRSAGDRRQAGPSRESILHHHPGKGRSAGFPCVQLCDRFGRVGKQRGMPEVSLGHLPAAAGEERGVDVQFEVEAKPAVRLVLTHRAKDAHDRFGR